MRRMRENDSKDEGRRIRTKAFCPSHPSSFILRFSYFDAMPLVSREVVVSNKLGLHARPAMQFVDLANQFTSQVTVYKGGDEPEQADGKSVMQMIILAATEGTPLKIVAE